MLLLLLIFTAVAARSDPSEFPHFISNESLSLDNSTLDVPLASLLDAAPVTFNEDDVWGEWTVDIPCSDSCGACGHIRYKRECLCSDQEGCPCSEGEFKVEVCGTNLCTFPRRTCCEGFRKVAVVNGFECAIEGGEPHPTISAARQNVEKRKKLFKRKKAETADAPVPPEVPTKEIWSDWAIVSPCTATCGACGRVKYSRDCLCVGEEGCPCSGRALREEVCATRLCPFPSHTCCEGFKKISTSQGLECGPKNVVPAENLFSSSTAPPTPVSTRKAVEKRAKVVHDHHKVAHEQEAAVVWGEWRVTQSCSDICGACGRMHYSRECLCVGRADCPCREKETRVEVCATDLCHFPRHTCCDGFVKMQTETGMKCGKEKEEEPANRWLKDDSNQPSFLPPNHIIPTEDSPDSRHFLGEKKMEIVEEDLPKTRVKKEEAPAVWSDWVVAMPCTSDCGGCGRIHFTRECLCSGEEGCPCRDRESRVEVCATNLCHFPRHTCCDGFRKIQTLEGFKCAAARASDERICAGTWTPWIQDSAVGQCSSTCGMCGKRRVATRKCEPPSCECVGDSELFEPCGRYPCTEGQSCCEGFVKGRVEGVEECIPKSAVPPALSAASRKFLDRKKSEEKQEIEKRKSQLRQILPVLETPANCSWGAWREVDSECSGSCGMCGVRVSARRNCLPKGCNCVGASTRYEDCGEGICTDREKPCCGFYTKSSVNGALTCIDPVSEVREKPVPVRRAAAKREEQKTTFSTSTCRGVWSPFSAAPLSHCDHSCGLCGHRAVAERHCIPQGCTCEGSNTLYERCGEIPCWNNPNSCCDGASVVLVDGRRICKENN